MPTTNSAAFSASSRLFDLNGEANRARKRQNRATIAADVRRFAHVINKDRVLGTHRDLSQRHKVIAICFSFDVGCSLDAVPLLAAAPGLAASKAGTLAACC